MLCLALEQAVDGRLDLSRTGTDDVEVQVGTCDELI
jgi:hypothetical protein